MKRLRHDQFVELAMIDKGSYMSGHVLLNLLNELGKKIIGFPKRVE